MQERTNPPANPTIPKHQLPPDEPPKKKKRRWLKVLGMLAILLVLLVVLLPTIVSLSPVRSLIVGQAQAFVPHGKLAIDDWSFGWFSPVGITGVKVYDDKNALVLSVDQVKTDALSLLKLARQQFDLTGVVVDADATNVTVYPDGKTNLHHIFGLDEQKAPTAAPSQPAPSSGPQEVAIPNVHGDIELKLRGAIHVVDAEGNPLSTLQLRQGSGGKIKIDDINKGVAPNLMLIYDVDNGPQSTVTVAGTVDAVENNKLDLAKLTLALKIVLSEIDLRAADPVLAIAGVKDTHVKSGTINGELAINIQPGKPDVKGEFVVRNPHIIAPQLQDEYKADEIRIPISLAVDGEGAAARYKVDTRLTAPEFWAAITGEVSQTAVDNLIKRQMPGSESGITLSFSADPKKLGTTFRNTLKLLPGLTVDGGEIKSVIDVLLKADRVELKTNSNVTLAARNDGKAISVPPINLTTGVSVTNLTDPIQGVHDLTLAMTSDFLHFKGGGKSIGDVKVEGGYDLTKLQKLGEQFADLGKTSLAGTGNFSVHSWQQDAKTLRADAGLKGDGLRVVLEGREPIDLALIDGGVSAQLPFDPQKPEVKKIEWVTGNLNLTPAAGRPALVEGKVKVRNVDLKQKNVGAIELTQGAVSDLPLLQRLIRPVFDLKKETGIELQSGAAYLAASGWVEGGRAISIVDLSASLTSLRISKGDQVVLNEKKIAFNTAANISIGDTEQSVELVKFTLDSLLVSIRKIDGQKFDVTLAQGMPRGNVPIAITKVDLLRVNAIARAFAGDGAATLPVVSSGYFTGSINLKGGQDQDSSVLVAGDVRELTIDQTPVKNEQIALNLNGKYVKADSTGTGKMTLRSGFASIEADGIVVDLGESTPTLHRLRKAFVRGGVADVAKAQAVASALVPGLKLPVDAAGDVALELNAEQDQAKATKIALSITGTGLSMRNDLGQSYAFGKDQVTVKAETYVEGAEEISILTVKKLDANAGFASATATKEIVVTDPTKPNATYNGELEAKANLESTAKVLQVLTSAAKPMAFRGAATFKETIGTQNGQIALKGGGTIDEFASLDPDTGKPQLTEKQVKITNDVVADLTNKNAAINAVTLDMASSQAAKATITGGVNDWVKQRQLNDIKIKFDGIGEKLWPIVYAAMSPEQQTTFKDASLYGPISVDLVAGGAYPDAPAWNESIRSTTATGTIKLTQANNFYGAYVEKFEQKFTLGANAKQAGVLVTDRETKAFAINKGEGNFGSIVVNLADPAMPVSIGRKQKLLTKVQINEIMAAQLGSYASVLFKDSKKASGILDLQVIECNAVPIADLMSGNGNASFLYSLTDLNLDSPLLSTLAGKLDWGTEGFVGNIRNGTLVLKDGVAYQNMTLDITRMVDGEDPKTKRPTKVESLEHLKFDGGIDLKAARFKDYSLWISRGMLFGDLKKYLPNGATLPLRGSITDTNSLVSQSITGLIGEAAKGAVEGKLEDAIKDLFNKDKDDKRRSR